tara:strand:- start:19565 stop:19780 length:216 start_codon:yes stop_codon:yes gene_type:complete
MSLKTKIRILLLKRKARAAHARMQVPAHFDCGRQLADHIMGGKLSAAKREFEEVMSELRRIDPTAPSAKGS